ncbi:MAG TPA: hypothetical protein VML00_12790, partial [Bacteroidota bacterium]|nr:hypothetical protein [Bacteroidota bacterium]
AVFAAGRVIMADWYYPPAFAAYVVTVACAWAWLGMRTRRPLAFARCAAGIRALGVPALALLLVAGIARWRVDPGEWFRREPVRLGGWLKENASRGSSVLLEPIGYVGWVSGLYVHDEVGLVSPRVLEYRTRFGDSDRWFLHYIRDTRPTYVVLQAREIRENRLFLGHGDGIFADSVERAWFSSAYTKIAFPPPAGEDSTYAYNLYRLTDDRRP